MPLFSEWSFWFSVVCLLVGLFLFWRVPTLRTGENNNQQKISNTEVSVIIPARNEETRIGKLLESLKNQTLIPSEVLVVNDHSSDGTTALVESMGYRVLESQALPEGWTGKNWACWQGAQVSKGDILVFLDADVWLDTHGLARIVSKFEENRGLISIQPFHYTQSVYEQFSCFFNIILMMSTNAFTPLGEKVPSNGGFGPCIACTRDDYFTAGGHKESRKAVLESIPLAAAFQKQNINVNLFGGRHFVFFRMYPNGLADLIEGWSKGFSRGATTLKWPFLILIVGWVWGCFHVTSGLIKAAFGDGLPLYAASGLFFLLALEIYWMLRRIGNFHILTALFFPIPLIFFALIMLYSFILNFIIRRVTWHDREIPQDKNTS